MNTTKLTTMLLSFLAALTLTTSCLSDGDNTETNMPTEEELQRAALQNVGNYAGTMFYASNNQEKAASVDLKWEVNNMGKSMVIYDVPAKALAVSIKDKEIKAAVEAADNVTIRGDLSYDMLTPVIRSYFKPNNVRIPITSNGKEEVLVFTFQYTYSCYCYTSSADRQMDAWMYLESVKAESGWNVEIFTNLGYPTYRLVTSDLVNKANGTLTQE